MKTLLLLLCLVLCSCSSLAKFGKAACDAQQDIANTVEDALAWAGAPGMLISNIVNTTLKIGCKLIDITVSAPNDLAIDVGLTSEESNATPSEGAASRPSDDSGR